MQRSFSILRVFTWQTFSQLFLLMGVAIMILPFLYMVGTSFKPPSEVISWPPTLVPEKPTLENYATLRTAAPFGRFFLNSLIVSIVSTLGIITTSTLAGYIFSKFRFPGRTILFILLLSTAMVPFETYLIPLYLIAKNLKLLNTYAGLVGPYLIMSFGIFLMRQNIGTAIPDELLDAARIDGASEWRIFFQLVVPLSKSAISALGILAFIQAWSAFIWPLILATEREMYTMEVGLSIFQRRFTIEYGSITAGSTISILPILIIFLILRRHIIRGITLTGLRG
ncbi:binding-protein-dependent transport systems inner membrane component [Candidatus Vecturithrix granuli]|uniref:Binding-protein-dependent transport systems inner membrane component n=1 Tax=Vecturithrix granuli TaxID=1499967 RepID=A0A081C3L1_VECG1|nr:binding-protein-dependent transport systems inner membrane component [Candidatus Vecturithrix granuli]